MKKGYFAFIIFLFFNLILFGQKPSMDSLKIQKLAGLCKVWGYLKYYHPKIQKGQIDWDTTLISFIPKVLNSTNYDDYNETINQLILLPGSTKKITPFKHLPKDTTYNNFDYKWINNESLFTRSNSEMLNNIIESYKPRTNIYLKKELNKYYYGDPNFEKYNNSNNYYPDTSHALLCLFRYWNVINYFFAYKKNTTKNWNDVLIEFIPKILESAGSKNFYLSFAELITQINDCHSFIENYNVKQELGNLKSLTLPLLPFNVNYIDGKTIITDVYSPQHKVNLKKGDIILKINNLDIEKKREDLKKYCGCSTQSTIEREINRNLLGPTYTDISILASDSFNLTKEAFISDPQSDWYIKNDSVCQTLSGNIGYINLENITAPELRHSFNYFKNKKALIFDLRNNSNINLSAIALRLPKKNHKNESFAIYYSNNLKYPGSFKCHQRKTFYLGLKPLYKQYRGKVIFLINENVQSTYEFTLMFFQAVNEIKLIGSNTAGTDGAAFSFLVQNNFLTYFTGDALFYPDRSPTQRIGIKPDIFIVPTIKGIREDKDEVLMQAINYVQKEN